MTIWASFFKRRLLVTLLLGFSCGLPLIAVGSTLQAWLQSRGVPLSVIGAVSLISIPYSFKFLWSPIIDRFTVPGFGRRKGWMYLSQLGTAAAFIALSLIDPIETPLLFGNVALVIAFFSATQDIVVDAHRRDTLSDNELGLGSSLFVTGYRLGMLASGAFALVLSDHIAWREVYLILAALMGVGMLGSLLSDEPTGITPPKELKSAVIDPFKDFFKREGAFYFLAFILLYKIGDNLAANLTMPLYLSLGFTRETIGYFGKTIGLASLILGGLFGGALMIRMGIMKSLLVFGLFQAVSNGAFSVLAYAGNDTNVLLGAIAFENFTGGMGTAAYMAFMSALCEKRFSATQYALFSSIMGIPRSFLAAPSGAVAEAVGWEAYFLLCVVVALPGLLLASYIGKRYFGDQKRGRMIISEL